MESVAPTRAQLLMNLHLRRAEALQQQIKFQARTNLHTFFKYYVWPVLEPKTQFVDNWHIHAICEHLEAVHRGEIQRLIVSMPFRMLKSRIISQAFPAWEWIDTPHLQYLSSSYAKDVATRDAVEARRIIESERYQKDFGDSFELTGDQNVKTRYQNNKQGTRIVTSTDSAGTGFGGNRIIIDDPLSSLEADSEAARKLAIEWYKGTAVTRVNDHKRDAIIVVHQRLHLEDLTGYLLEKESGMWEHLVLPMEYDPALRKTTSLGYEDPRTEEGEPLCPDRLDTDDIAKMKISLGSYHSAAQLQQNPDSRGGTIFLRDHWKFFEVLPHIEDYVISVDCTFKGLSATEKKKKNDVDYVAITVWGTSGPNCYLLYRVHEQMGFNATVVAIKAVLGVFPSPLAVLIEEAANGYAVIESLQEQVPGVIPIDPEGGKVARAYSIEPWHQAGNLWLPDPSIDPSIEKYLSEMSNFPNGTHDDQVDSTTQCIHWIRKRATDGMGLFTYYKELAAKQGRVQQKQSVFYQSKI